MRLPLVSRALLEQSLATLERWIASSSAREDRLHAIIDAQNGRYESLLSRYHMLRLQGAAEAAAFAPPPPDKPFDRVLSAVNDACAGKDFRVRKAMLAAVARDRAADLTDDDIILRIARGNRVADELESSSLPQNPGADRPPS